MVMKKGILIAALIATGSWTSASVKATELVYEPINPSFGGNPLNGSFLLSKANSQNALIQRLTASAPMTNAFKNHSNAPISIV